MHTGTRRTLQAAVQDVQQRRSCHLIAVLFHFNIRFVMDGLEAVRRIRADSRYADLPVLAMTANAMSGDRELCIKAGMNDHIAKPIGPMVLYKNIIRVLCS